MTNPTRIVYGRREAMIAEYSALDPRSVGIAADDCRYIVLPLGNGQWDGEWHRTLNAARADAHDVARHYGISVETV